LQAKFNKINDILLISRPMDYIGSDFILTDLPKSSYIPVCLSSSRFFPSFFRHFARCLRYLNALRANAYNSRMYHRPSTGAH